MPNRFIKESCRSSKSLATLPDKAERLHWRLVTVADDYGRFEADPEVVKAECFKRPTAGITTESVSKCLQMLADANILKLYENTEHRYGYFVKWEQHQGKPRCLRSKYPDPPVDKSNPLADASVCKQMLASSESESESVSATADEEKENLSLFSKFWAAYPRKEGKGACRDWWGKKKPSAEMLQTMLAAIEKARGTDKWHEQKGKFIPMPMTWLNQGRWEDELLDAVKPAWRTT